MTFTFKKTITEKFASTFQYFRGLECNVYYDINKFNKKRHFFDFQGFQK